MRLDEIIKLTEAPEDGTFAGVRFWKPDAEGLKQFSEDSGIPNQTPIEDYHVTLLYSTTPVPEYEPREFYKMALYCQPKDVKLWGDDEKKALVLTLDCPGLVKRHKYLMDQFPHATWDHNEYIPHVTLSYDAGDFDIDSLDLNKIGMLTLVGEYSDDIDPDWSDDAKE